MKKTYYFLVIGVILLILSTAIGERYAFSLLIPQSGDSVRVITSDYYIRKISFDISMKILGILFIIIPSIMFERKNK